MNDIVFISELTIDNQNEFIKTEYPEFMYSALYGYLFEKLDLRGIERKYLGKEHQGFFSKVVLNHLGIDTSKKSKNMGIYYKKDVKEVTEEMLLSSDPMILNIANILLKHNN